MLSLSPIFEVGSIVNRFPTGVVPADLRLFNALSNA
ncbi:hypothetical protein PMIT1318_00319 [Prochlorococcus marinus str. MIT 1318]|nr:hypothetical protein PMIT1318_00319 [Prochlorococcus marinus str. MIT 1318]